MVESNILFLSPYQQHLYIYINTSGIEARISCNNFVNTMPVNSLDSFVTMGPFY